MTVRMACLPSAFESDCFGSRRLADAPALWMTGLPWDGLAGWEMYGSVDCGLEIYKDRK